MTFQNKKIVSFLPSATEILYEIGGGSQIVGVTHECKYPEDAKAKPKVINSSFDASSMTSKEIDNKIVELFKASPSTLLHVNAQLIYFSSSIAIVSALSLTS